MGELERPSLITVRPHRKKCFRTAPNGLELEIRRREFHEYYHQSPSQDTVACSFRRRHLCPSPTADGSSSRTLARWVAHSRPDIAFDEPCGRLDLFTGGTGTAYCLRISSIYDGMRPNGNNWLSFRPAGRNGAPSSRYLVTPELLDTQPEMLSSARTHRPVQ